MTKALVKFHHFGRHHQLTIRLRRIAGKIVVMLAFCWPERRRGSDRGDNAAGKAATGIERSDCDKVLDGDLDEYIEASLKQGL